MITSSHKSVPIRTKQSIKKQTHKFKHNWKDLGETKKHDVDGKKEEAVNIFCPFLYKTFFLLRIKDYTKNLTIVDHKHTETGINQTNFSIIRWCDALMLHTNYILYINRIKIHKRNTTTTLVSY